MPITTFPEDTLTLIREVPATAPTLLTIVVGAYRHADFIGECLASIDAIAAPDIELIVIDDGSPDDTLRVCREHVFSPQLPLRLYTKRNAGLTDSLRRGLALARGEHVAFIGSDDAYLPAGLAEVLSSLRTGIWRGDATVCQGIMFDDVEESLIYKQDALDLFKQPPEEIYRRLCLYLFYVLLLQTTIFRTAFLREIDPWGRKRTLDDWPTFILVLEAAAKGHASVRYEPDLLLSRYRQHESGVSRRLTHMLSIAEQSALEVVPPKWRRPALANIRIQFGLTHLYQRNVGVGLLLCIRGLLTCPTPVVIAQVVRRGARFIRKRLAGQSAIAEST